MPEILRVRSDGGILVLTLNRPEKLNALNRALIEAIGDALAGAETDRLVRAIVITGAGRAFSAGADIAEFASAMEAGPATASRDFVRPGQSLTRRIETFRKPIIAAVNGLAFGGGCEIVEAMHMAVASGAATFAKAEIKIGVIPVFGGTQRLPRHVGRKKALEMILTGDSMPAVEAERLGLINAVVPAGDELAAAIQLARRVASMPEPAVAAALAAVHRGADLPIDEGLSAEAGAFEAIWTGGDASNGVRKFLGNRGGGRHAVRSDE